jgi:hypothetical protein
LLALWLEPLPARRALVGQRAVAAARHSRDADRRAKIHERLCASVVERRAGALEDTAHVHVDRQYGPAEREAGNRVRRVAAHTGQRGQVLGPTVRRNLACHEMQVDGPPVVAEPCHSRSTSAVGAAASAWTVGQRSSQATKRGTRAA